MKKGLKITAIVLGSILLILLILPFALRGKIDAIVKKEAAKSLTATLDFNNLGISFFRNFPNASIDLKGLTLVGTGDFKADTLISAERLSMTVNVMSLFRNTGFEISRLTLVAPKVKAHALADGRVNWDIMRPDSVPTNSPNSSDESSFKLLMKDVKASNGEVLYIDDSSKISFYAANIDLHLKGDLTANQSDLNLLFTSNNVYAMMDNIKILSNANAEGEMVINADLKNYKFTFKENKFKLNAMEFGLDGWVAMPNEPIDMDLKINSSTINFKDVLSMVPALYTKDFKDLTASGDLLINAWAKGRMMGDTLPQFAVEASVKNGKFKYASLPKSVENINIVASVTNSTGFADNTIIDVPTMSMSFGGNNVSGSLHMVNPVSDPKFDAKAKGTVNLGMIKEVYPLGDSISLSGIVTADIAISAKMSDIEKERYENVKGEGSFSVNNMTTEMTGFPKVLISKASATITPSTMNLGELAMTLGKSDINASGSVSNYLSYFLKDQTLSGKLKLTSNKIDLNELMGEKTASSGAAADTTPLSVIEVPKNLNLKFEASIKQLLFQKMTLNNVFGEMSVSDGVLAMNKLNMNALGGSIQTSGSYSTAKNPKSPDLKMSLNISKASFAQTFKELDMVKKFVPLFEKTGGDYSLTMDMNTTLGSDMQPDLKTLVAKGTLESGNIKVDNIKAFEILSTLMKNDALKNIEAKDVKIKYEIANGVINTSPFDIKMGNINMNLAGATGLDQTINYNAKVTLPKSNVTTYVSAINAHIGGTFTNPKVELGVKDMVEDALKQAIGSKITGATTNLADEAAKKADELRAQAEAASQKLVDAAKEQGDKLVEKAKDPISKIAAQTSANLLVKEAEKQGKKIKDEAEIQIQKILSEVPK